MRKMKVTLHRDGSQQIEVLGAVGPECVEFSRVFERRLGVPVCERQLKPEYHESEPQVERDYEVER